MDNVNQMDSEYGIFVKKIASWIFYGYANPCFHD